MHFDEINKCTYANNEIIIQSKLKLGVMSNMA